MGIRLLTRGLKSHISYATLVFMKNNIKPKDKELLIAVITKHAPNAKIYLFGSRARATNSPESDIDLAIDVGKPAPISLIGRMYEEIEESPIPFCVDIVDVRSVGDDMKEQINKQGVVWKS